MKKTLLFLSLFGSLATYAQEQTISFEEVEGYTEGNLIGQNTWESYGYITEGHANVSSNKASIGNFSAQLVADTANEGNWGGIVYQLPHAQKFIISADVNLDTLGESDHDLLSIYDNSSGEFEYISGFYFDYLGDIIIGDALTTQSSGNWTANTWYNLKADYDFTDRTVDLYLNNSFIRTVNIPSGIEKATEVDFEFDNYSGFSVDNIHIINLDILGNTDKLASPVAIYPNPTTDRIHIKNISNIKTLEIFDIEGNSIASNINSSSIKVEHLPKGIYFIKVKTSTTTLTHKFIKK